MTHEWAEVFRERLAARGYELLSCAHDPAYGWTIEFRAAGDPAAPVREFEASTTVSVQTRIHRLPVQSVRS